MYLKHSNHTSWFKKIALLGSGDAKTFSLALALAPHTSYLVKLSQPNILSNVTSPHYISLQFAPESARYLLAAGRREEALETLRKAAKMNGKSLPRGTLVETQKVCIF